MKTKSDIDAEAKVEAEVRSETEAEIEVEAEVGFEIEVEARSEAEAGVEIEVEARSEAEARSRPRLRPGLMPRLRPRSTAFLYLVLKTVRSINSLLMGHDQPHRMPPVPEVGGCTIA